MALILIMLILPGLFAPKNYDECVTKGGQEAPIKNLEKAVSPQFKTYCVYQGDHYFYK